jgi:Uma2 family endonuclease
MASPRVSLPDASRIERPAVIEMSLEDFLAWDHEGGLAEWVDGEAHLYLSNDFNHQRIVEFLHIFLSGMVRLGGGGWVKLAPYAMRALPSGPAREPDLLVVLAEHGRPGAAVLDGPADLVIEVVSEESSSRDRTDKFFEYEAGGVREYWIIDSREGRGRADFYVLGPDPAGSSRRVFLPVCTDESGVFRSQVLPGCSLKVSWLFDEAADPFACISEAAGPDGLARLAGGPRS